MKLYTLQIPQDAAEGRLLPWVKRMLPQVSDRAVRAAFDKRDVKLNGRRVDRQAMLLPGAEVKLYTPEEAERPLMDILYQDANVLIVRKPAGISCEPDQKGGITVPQLAWDMLRRRDPLAAEPLLCHRLDNPTEGLLLLALNPESQQAMHQAFRERKIHKHYICLTKGTPKWDHQVLRAWLKKDAEKAKVQVLEWEERGAVPIVTEYTVLERGECARLDIALHTGRTHQIRAQMAAVGHPLLGDDLYGDRKFNKLKKAKRLMLCATSLRFELEGEWSYLNRKTFTIDPGF